MQICHTISISCLRCGYHSVLLSNLDLAFRLKLIMIIIGFVAKKEI